MSCGGRGSSNLKSYCLGKKSKGWSRSRYVEIKKSKVSDKNNGQLKEKEPSVHDTQEHRDLSSPVKNILDIFEGEIREGPSGKEREVK